MKIPEFFFDSEVREGFYIPAKMKRCWAAMLEVLNEIAMVCERHHLKWWMDWGTMLGQIRHGGFIPWDDDIDISMLRADYMKFLEVAPGELPEGYHLANIYNQPDYAGSITRVINYESVSFREEYLEKNQGFPYISGIDIMVIDFVHKDPVKDRDICDKVNRLHMLAGSMEPELVYKQVPGFHKLIDDFETELHHTFSRTRSISQQLEIMGQDIMSSVKREEAELAASMGARATRPDFNAVFPISYYEEFITLPFEFYEVPVPVHYDEMLKKIFGNYMTPVRGGGTHEYPTWCRQEEVVLKETGKSAWPQYAYSKPDEQT